MTPNLVLQQLQSSRPRIAVIRALQLGDVLCAVPALRALRHAVPQAEISFIGLPWARSFVARFSDCCDSFREFPGFPGLPERELALPRLMAFLQDVQQSPYDLVIQMHGSGSFINPFMQLMGAPRVAGYYIPGDLCPDNESFLAYPDNVHEVQRHLQLTEFLGAPSCGDHLEFPITEEDHDQLGRITGTDKLKSRQYICVHPGARWPSRRWSAGKFAAIADALFDRGLDIVLTGSRDEMNLVAEVSQKMAAPHLNLAGQTSLGALAALLRNARLLVSVDTGVSHVAAALQVPSVVIVLGSDYARWTPLNKRLHRMVAEQVDCRPCDNMICPIGHDCETRLPVSTVLQTAQEMLHFSPGHSVRLAMA